MPTKPRKSKYNAQKTSVDGRTFDSAKEAKRYLVLRDMQERGEISGLECQVPFTLIPAQKRDDGKTERAVTYRSDFCYNEVSADGSFRFVVEDVKGYRGGAAYAVFKIKRKLMLYKYGITVKEI